MIRKLCFFLSSLLVIVFNAAQGQAAALTSEETSARCTALATADFSQTLDAPTQITGAKLIPAEGDVPEYCQLDGYVSPNVGIELRLPTDRWNGKFLEMGCGGLCGEFSTYTLKAGHDCDHGLRKGYACLVSNQGHVSTEVDGKWAYNNLQAQVDYAFRAAHVAALAGKAITERYYAQAPRKAYFWGCSGGGREGMVEAQQFPSDFDGIAVVAPGFHLADVMMSLLWNWRAATAGDKALFSAADVALLHEAAVAQCDGDDGIKDGVVGNPQGCQFDPATLVCKAGAAARCLSPAQAEAAKKIYSGVMNSKGESLFPGMVPGEESSISTSAELSSLPRDFFQYMGFNPAPGPGWKPTEFDFDRDPKRLAFARSLLSDSNPDLRKFKEAGGKLMLAHGWADEPLSPLATLDYYETVQKTMGGESKTRDFLRLFMVPGMAHCYGGDGAYAIDYLSYLEDWVEGGRAPDVMIGAHVKKEKYSGYSYKLPANPADVTFTRPVYPYPLRARYKGKGDPNSASSFEPVGYEVRGSK